jgi:hypothetical protein
MKFFTHNQLPISINGTCGQGFIETTFDELVAKFGKPMEEGFDVIKSDAEWHIQWDDGEIGTIYNWKNGRNYLGSDGLETWEITEWNIGGSSSAVVSRIKSIVREDVTGRATALPLP